MSAHLTEAHYDWVQAVLGIDARGKANGGAPADDIVARAARGAHERRRTRRPGEG
jgi:hypothetical protein